MIKKEFPQTKLIENVENVGFAIANNQVLREATGDYYLLLNSDTIIPETSIADLIKFLDMNREVAAASPKLINAEGKVQYIPKSLPSFHTEVLDCLTYHFPPVNRIFRKLVSRERKEWWSSGKQHKLIYCQWPAWSLEKKLLIE